MAAVGKESEVAPPTGGANRQRSRGAKMNKYVVCKHQEIENLSERENNKNGV